MLVLVLLPLDPVEVVPDADEVVLAALTFAAVDDVVLPAALVVLADEPACTVEPVLLMTATLAKSVVVPKAALKASACAPVPVEAASAAEVAVWQVEIAAALALHLSWSCWHMKLVITSIPSAEP